MLQLITIFIINHESSHQRRIAMIVTTVGVLSVLVYFFFSAEHKGFVGGVSKVGIWFLMVSFGAAFGYTIMGRISILIGRVVYLLSDWLGIA